jgi:hypothetical protein
MTFITAFVLSSLGAVQEDVGRQVLDLIEKLDSDRIEERYEAARKLRGLGQTAVPELEKVAGKVELAAVVLKTIAIAREIPEIVRRYPGFEERLATAGPRAWTELFLKFWCREKDEDPTFEGLPARERTILVTRALPGAREDTEENHVLQAVRNYKIAEALPEVRRIAKVAGSWQNLCLAIIGEMGTAAEAPILRSALGASSAKTRVTAIEGFFRVRDGESSKALLGALRDSSSGVRYKAVEVIGWMDLKEAVPALIERLEDEELSVRVEALRALDRFDAREAIEKIEPLLNGESLPVRHHAAAALCRLGSPKGATVFLSTPRERIWDAFSYRVDTVVYRCHFHPETLDTLNGARQPEAWRQLKHAPFGAADFKGTGRMALEKAARDARLSIEIPAQLPDEANSWLSGAYSGWYPWMPDSALRVLESARTAGLRFILEPERIRFVSAEEEETFWNRWVAGEKK